MDFCSILIQFGLHFTPFSVSFWKSRFRYPFLTVFCRPLLPVCPPVGLKWRSKILLFFNEKKHWFFSWFLESFWHPFWSQFPSKFHPKSTLKRKRWFSQNERLVQARAPSGRVRGLKILQKAIPKSIKKTMHFWSEKITENGSQNGPQKHLTWV